MTSKTTRRAVLAGAATIPALSLPAFASSNPPDDPIFAVIEKHRALIVSELKASRHAFFMSDAHPHKETASRFANGFIERRDEAGQTLANIVPTTFAGVLALLLYMQEVNGGEIVLQETPENPLDGWRSGPSTWPQIKDSDGVNVYPFILLKKIHRALSRMATLAV